MSFFKILTMELFFNSPLVRTYTRKLLDSIKKRSDYTELLEEAENDTVVFEIAENLMIKIVPVTKLSKEAIERVIENEMDKKNIHSSHRINEIVRKGLLRYQVKVQYMTFLAAKITELKKMEERYVNDIHHSFMQGEGVRITEEIDD